MRSNYFEDWFLYDLSKRIDNFFPIVVSLTEIEKKLAFTVILSFRLIVFEMTDDWNYLLRHQGYFTWITFHRSSIPFLIITFSNIFFLY
jgi:hypothetical protein